LFTGRSKVKGFGSGVPITTLKSFKKGPHIWLSKEFSGKTTLKKREINRRLHN
jgi:hypothetical protein